MERRKLGRAVDHHFMSKLFCGFAVIVEILRATSVLVSPMHKDQTHVAPPCTHAVPIPSSIDDLDQLSEPYDLAVMSCQVLPDPADQPVIMCGSAENVLEQFGAVAAHHELCLFCFALLKSMSMRNVNNLSVFYSLLSCHRL